MNPIEHLREEHRQIGRVLSLLDDAMDRARTGEPLNPTLLRRAAEFFLRPVAKAHESKEHLLYQAMRTARLPVREALIDRVVLEHSVGREQMLDWRRAAEALLEGVAKPQEVLDIVGNAMRMHREHTHEEEKVVFPLAQRLLSREVLETLRSKFAVIEGTHGSIAAAADQIERAFAMKQPIAAGGVR